MSSFGHREPVAPSPLCSSAFPIAGGHGWKDRYSPTIYKERDFISISFQTKTGMTSSFKKSLYWCKNAVRWYQLQPGWWNLTPPTRETRGRTEHRQSTLFLWLKPSLAVQAPIKLMQSSSMHVISGGVYSVRGQPRPSIHSHRGKSGAT